MAGNPFYLGGVDVAGVVLARVDQRDAIGTYAALIDEIRARCGAEVASLFAEPVRGVNRVTGEDTVSWYCAVEGTPFALAQLDPAGRRPVAALLTERLRSFASLFGEPRSGALFASWLHVLSADSVLAVAGQPVIKNWGMLPAGVAGSEEARDAHFRQTLAPYLPAMPTPPFLNVEAPPFTGRIRQMAERESARAAAPPPPPAAPAQPTPEPAPAAAAAAAPPVTPWQQRPWAAPAAASGVAAAILAVLLFGHVLRYPAAADPAADDAAIQAQRETNQALRDQLERLRKGAANTCQALPGTPPRAAANDPPLLPPSPERTPVTTPAPEGGRPAVSSLGALLDKATVLVLAGDSLGSGFFISDRTIVTNHHVVGDLAEVRVGNKALGGLVPARVVAVGAGRTRGTQDIAVLQIEPKAGTAALDIGVLPERLDPVTAAGYPGAVVETIKNGNGLPEANFTQGILTSHQMQAPAGIGTIIHTAQIGHGNSGGPLVDVGGCAVGINAWLSVDTEENVIFSSYFQALDAAELRNFLKAHQIAFSAADAPCRPAVAPAPAAPPAPAPGAPAAPPAAPATGPH